MKSENECSICHGKLHVYKTVKDKITGQKKGVWKRCDCLSEKIKDYHLISCGHLENAQPLKFTFPTDEKKGYLGWDKQSWFFKTDIKQGQRVLAYLFSQDVNKKYFFVTAYGLVEIYLSGKDKDGDYELPELTSKHKTMEDLIPYDVIAVALGYGELPNKLLPSLVTQVFQMREIRSKPTILLTPWDSKRIDKEYGNGRLNDLVNGLVKVSL